MSSKIFQFENDFVDEKDMLIPEDVADKLASGTVDALTQTEEPISDLCALQTYINQFDHAHLSDEGTFQIFNISEFQREILEEGLSIKDKDTIVDYPVGTYIYSKYDSNKVLSLGDFIMRLRSNIYYVGGSLDLKK